MSSPKWAELSATPLFQACAAAQHAAWRVAPELRRSVFTQRLNQVLGPKAAEPILLTAIALFDAQTAPPRGWVDPPENMHFECCPRCQILSGKRYSQAPNGRIRMNALRDRDWLARQYALGKHTRDIAKSIGACMGSVTHWARKHGIETMKRKPFELDPEVAEMHQAGKCPGEIAEHFDVKVQTIRKILSRQGLATGKHGHHYFAREWWVEHLITRNLTTHQIARIAGIVPHNCAYFIKKFGLEHVTAERSCRKTRSRWKHKYPQLADANQCRALLDRHGTYEGAARELGCAASLVKNWETRHFGKQPARHRQGVPHAAREWWTQRLDRGLTTNQLAEDAGITEKNAKEKLRVLGGGLLAQAYRNNVAAEKRKRPPMWAVARPA